MLVELLRPAGPDLARRWLSALLIVPADERETVVAAVERKVCECYPHGASAGAGAHPPGGGRGLTLVQPPEQREGYVEQVEVSFEDVPVAGVRATRAARGDVRKRRGRA